jgi:hypothetical protein
MLRSNEVLYYNPLERTVDIVSIDTGEIKKAKIPYPAMKNSWTNIEVFPESGLFCFVEIEKFFKP